MSDDGGGGGGGFLEETWNDVEDAASGFGRSLREDPWMTAGTLGLFGGVPQMATGSVQTVQRVQDDLRDQAAGEMEKEEARLEAKRRALEAARPKDPNLAPLARQRTRRGRSDTILTGGQSLGSTPRGKTLLGL